MALTRFCPLQLEDAFPQLGKDYVCCNGLDSILPIATALALALANPRDRNRLRFRLSENRAAKLVPRIEAVSPQEVTRQRRLTRDSYKCSDIIITR